MKTIHKYILEPYNGMRTRYSCPNCSKEKTFSLYIDTETGEHIHPNVGRCNRESNCGYHYTPKQYFHDNNISYDVSHHETFKPKVALTLYKPVSFIPVEVFKGSLKSYQTNHFVNFLIDLFGDKITSELVSSYFIGTSNYWEGATVFWQIDITGKIRTGKIMLYNPENGKRVKEPFNHIHWAHKLLFKSEFELKQCLFGEHLLINNTRPVAIVESEKTAIIASVYLPQFVWLAVGSLTNLNIEKCNVLKGKQVILFPDLKCFDKWRNKAEELSNIANFLTSDLLELKASYEEKEQGLDIADYLIKFDLQEFVQDNSQISETEVHSIADTNQSKEKEQNNFLTPISHEEYSYNESWEEEVLELDNFFKSIILPTYPIRLNNFTMVTDVNLFIQTHLAIVVSNMDKPRYKPYLIRLKELKNHFINN
ncbi:MAG: hypothetical protein KA807_11535 [Prolixibacteraceae bacterium]|nr:hypothetical protein [Prolixibacteraceae bacterium]